LLLPHGVDPVTQSYDSIRESILTLSESSESENRRSENRFDDFKMTRCIAAVVGRSDGGSCTVAPVVENRCVALDPPYYGAVEKKTSPLDFSLCFDNDAFQNRRCVSVQTSFEFPGAQLDISRGKEEATQTMATSFDPLGWNTLPIPQTSLEFGPEDWGRLKRGVLNEFPLEERAVENDRQSSRNSEKAVENEFGQQEIWKSEEKAPVHQVFWNNTERGCEFDHQTFWNTERAAILPPNEFDHQTFWNTERAASQPNEFNHTASIHEERYPWLRVENLLRQLPPLPVAPVAPTRRYPVDAVIKTYVLFRQQQALLAQ